MTSWNKKLKAARLVIKLPILDSAEACKNQRLKPDEEEDKEATRTRAKNTIIESD